MPVFILFLSLFRSYMRSFFKQQVKAMEWNQWHLPLILSLPPSCLPIAPFFPFLFIMLVVFISFNGDTPFPPSPLPPILPPSFSSNYFGECIWIWISFSPSFFGPFWLLVWRCLNVPIWTEMSLFINFSHVHFYFVSKDIKDHIMKMKCPALNMVPRWL